MTDRYGVDSTGNKQFPHVLYWFFTSTTAISLILGASFFSHKEEEQSVEVDPLFHRILIVANSFYVLVLFVILLYLANQYDRSVEEVLLDTLLLTVPIQLIVSVLLGLYFFYHPGRSGNRISANTVFISYNHSDRPLAEKIREYLVQHQIKVVIDFRDMKPGTDIMDFIEDAIKKSTVTLQIVSPNSIQSPWVLQETMYSIVSAKLMDRHFVACFYQMEKLEDAYVLKLLDELEAKMKVALETIEQLNERGVNTDYKQKEYSRLLDIHNNLTKAINYYQSRLRLTIIDERLAPELDKVISLIQRSKRASGTT